MSTLAERFSEKYEPVTETGCWLWTAATSPSGYGQFKFRGQRAFAHRVSWIINVGEIPDGLCILHKCDTPACINPAHLFLGTVLDNNADRHKKGRSGSAKGETNGQSKLTRESVLAIRESSDGANMLAAKYGVARRVIWGIRTGRMWGTVK